MKRLSEALRRELRDLARGPRGHYGPAIVRMQNGLAALGYAKERVEGDYEITELGCDAHACAELTPTQQTILLKADENVEGAWLRLSTARAEAARMEVLRLGTINLDFFHINDKGREVAAALRRVDAAEEARLGQRGGT